jgi:hypothetical protein
MNGTLDRWYVSGPLGVGSTFNELLDAHSASQISMSSIGSVIRHQGWENLNLLDSRPAGLGLGPNLNLWGLNAANKAVRLGTISARFTATADAGSASYLTFHAKRPTGDVGEVMRIDGDGNVNMSTPSFNTLTVGSGANGAIKVRHIDGKQVGNDNTDPLHLNWGTGKPVIVGSPGIPSAIYTYGDLSIRQFPANDTTSALTRLSLIGRAAGGGERTWTLYTAAVGGGWGVNPNAFEIWEYPATASRFQLRPGGDTILAPAGGNVGIGTGAPQAKLHVAGGDLRLDATRIIYCSGRLHINGEENLYLLNRGGVIVSRAWGGNGNLTVEGAVQGDMTITGRIGVNGQSPNPRTGGWGGGIHTWDLEVEGSAWSRNGWQTGPRDMAENFESEVVLEPGEVVSFHPERDSIIRSTSANDSLVCGVVSTAPGVLLNSDPDTPDRDELAPIALCGRVPCRVVDENGPIRRGDLLTSSSVPGHAMRAEPILVDGERVYRSGTIVGKALTPHASGQGVIDIFVSPS